MDASRDSSRLHPIPRFVLASQSPRRVELLAAAGFEFDVIRVDVDETRGPGEPPREYVSRLALAKASRAREHSGGRLVLAADTTVVIGGEVLGKPDDDEAAGEMLRRLSGATHEVLTGVAVAGGERTMVEVETTRVTFAPLTPGEIAWYVATGESRGKAGAYAVQGLASRFVTAIDGSYSNVVGLPIALVYRLLRKPDGC